MSAFRALLHSQINSNNNPSELMSVLNQQIPIVSRKRDFISVFYAILNFKEHICTYTNCGHNPPLLLRSNGKMELLEQGGAALNILEDATFDFDSVKLEPEDQIIFYTDGVTEVFSLNSEEYGVERLKEIVWESKDKSAGEIISNIVNSTKNFSGTKLYRDDFTLVVLKRK